MQLFFFIINYELVAPFPILYVSSHRNLWISFFFFYLSFTAYQDYFCHFELSQSLDGAKTWDPQEKSPDHP